MVTQAEINSINSARSTSMVFDIGAVSMPVTYTARQSEFTQMTIAQAQQLMGVHQQSMNSAPTIEHSLGMLDASPLPASFDCRKQFPGKIAPIRNQQQCGSCWAESATEVLSSRLAIQSNGKCNKVLSAQPLVSCAIFNCFMGNTLEAAWQYLGMNGTSTTDINPYVSGNGQVPPCTALVEGELYKANLLSGFTKYNIASNKSLQDNINAIKRALLSGPVQVAFQVTTSFMAYSGGVFGYKKNHKILGGHAVMLLGWDSDAHGEYWIAQNSWGPTWGLNGYFNIRMLTPGTPYTNYVKRTGLMTFESNAAVGSAILSPQCQPPTPPKPPPTPKPPTPKRKNYICVDGQCRRVAEGTGVYDKNQCQSVCGKTPPKSVSCVKGKCVSTVTGQGTYDSFDDCAAACGGKTKKGLNGIEIAGIVLGAAALIAVIVALSVLFTRKHRHPEQQDSSLLR